MTFFIPAFGLLLVLAFSGCQQQKPPFKPLWVSGYTETWQVNADLKAGLSGQETRAWASQSMKLHLRVDSVSKDSSAHLHFTVSDLVLASAERDSAENAFMAQRLAAYTSHFRLTPTGKLETSLEEPIWPELGPAWVSPSSLLKWVFPTWEWRPSRSSSEPTAPNSSTRHTLGPDSCGWDRGEKALPAGIDTLAFQFEWQFTPRFQGLFLSCPELPWLGLAQFRGERTGFGLKEFKWQAQAEFSTSPNTPLGGENKANSPLVLTREVLLRRL
jgi:hypothetical protein